MLIHLTAENWNWIELTRPLVWNEAVEFLGGDLETSGTWELLGQFQEGMVWSNAYEIKCQFLVDF